MPTNKPFFEICEYFIAIYLKLYHKRVQFGRWIILVDFKGTFEMIIFSLDIL